MQITSLKLSDFGPFNEVTVQFAPLAHHPFNVTVLVGNNGSGKTILLKALAISLSWLVARIRTEKGNGSHIAERYIRNGASAAIVSIAVADTSHPQVHLESEPDEEGNTFVWGTACVRQANKTKPHSSLTEASLLADHYRNLLTADNNASLPLIAYYPVERSVLDIPLKVKNEQIFDQLNGYDTSLDHGVDLHQFFEWFRLREDSENETGISDAAMAQISETFSPDSATWNTLSNLSASSRDSQLTAVRFAIGALLPGFANLRVQRNPHLQMLIDKHGATLDATQLSQGEKTMLALVGDIARRLAQLNPSLNDPLQGNGIILIDEVELHLHPTLQRDLIRRFSETFPNCQFVLTTQSPLVISDTKEILVYRLNDSGLETQIFGQ